MALRQLAQAIERVQPYRQPELAEREAVVGRIRLRTAELKGLQTQLTLRGNP